MLSTVRRTGNRIELFANEKWYYYDLLSSKIGEGAMGDVYEGYSFDGSEHVAIKCIKKEYANLPNIRQRAMMEASLMFRHKNLIEMIGCCMLHKDHGPMWIISRYVAGMNIDRYILQFNYSPTRVKQICNILFPVFDALTYIHSKNIVHMDIKPSNIMVENGCNTRLMDLGIAYVDDRIIAAESTTSALLGTPKYAAPEQFARAVPNGILNNSTDLFEMGVTIYELLTGFNPFSATSINEAVNKRQTEVLPYVKNVPNKVIDVLRKATAYQQEYRYQSAAEMKQALQTVLESSGKVPKTKWIYVLLASVVLLIISLLILFNIWNS